MTIDEGPLIGETAPRSAFGADTREGSKDLPADEFLYRQVFDAIMSQRLKPGKKLTEESLAGIFGVGRTVVRRALLRLSHDGVVIIRPNRGAAVSSPSVAEAREIFSARRLIECELIRNAAELVRTEDITRLNDIAQEEREHVEREQRGAAIRLSGDFHFALASVAGNDTLLRFLRSLIPQTALVIAQYERPPHEFSVWLEHEQMAAALGEGNASLASDLMDAHLNRIEDSLELDELDDTIDLDTVFSHVSTSR